MARRLRHMRRHPCLIPDPIIDALLARARTRCARAHLLDADSGQRAGCEGRPGGFGVSRDGFDGRLAGGGERGGIGHARGQGDGVAVLRGVGEELFAVRDGVLCGKAGEDGVADAGDGGAVMDRAAVLTGRSG